MEIKPIKTENDYNNSIKRIETLWGAKKDSIEGDELDLLCTLVESYEMHHYPIAPPDPIDAIKFRMEQLGMTKTDLAKYLGAQSRVSEVLSRKRQLTLKMVKSLYNDLKIPANILLSDNRNSTSLLK
ncbi:MAG: helix-turn-helix domain-containing protein [Paludibacter sp.]|jgi:HTH-type transcriptional regulator / antitoxin HigA